MRHLRLLLVALLLCGAIGVTAWARLQDNPASERKGQGGAPAGPPAVPVLAATAETQDVPVVRTSVGWVEPISVVTVRARVEGEVVAQIVEEGQFVRKGDLLFRIDDREVRAALAKDEAMLARDEAILARAQADADRARDLLARKVAAAQAVDQAVADAKIAAANVEADKAAIDTDNIRLGYTEVRAPIDGRAGAVRVTPGNIVRSSDGGEGLVTITQMKPLRVTFTLPERDVPELRAAAAHDGKVPVEVMLHNGTGARAQGDLVFIDSSVDSNSGTITAKAMLPNEDGALWPGQYVDVEVKLGVTKDAVTIPLVAVQPGQDGPFVYVIGQDQKVAVRQLKLGETQEQSVVVREGLQAGDRVVTEGQQRLKNGSRVTVRDKAQPAPATADAAPQGASS